LLDHVVESLLELVVDGLALLLLPDELVLQLVDLQVDSLHVHLTILSPALSILQPGDQVPDLIFEDVFPLVGLLLAHLVRVA